MLGASSDGVHRRASACEPFGARARLAAIDRAAQGSGRGIGAESIVLATRKGLVAREVWRPLVAVIEQRWETRFGEEAIRSLRESMALIVGGLDVELPDAVPEPSALDETETRPLRRSPGESGQPLATLLSQALFGFAIEFDRESEAPLALAANTLRVLGQEAVRVADLPRLTGAASEVSAIGWRLEALCDRRNESTSPWETRTTFRTRSSGTTRQPSRVGHRSTLGGAVRH